MWRTPSEMRGGRPEDAMSGEVGFAAGDGDAPRDDEDMGRRSSI